MITLQHDSSMYRFVHEPSYSCVRPLFHTATGSTVGTSSPGAHTCSEPSEQLASADESGMENFPLRNEDSASVSNSGTPLQRAGGAGAVVVLISCTAGSGLQA